MIESLESNCIVAVFPTCTRSTRGARSELLTREDVYFWYFSSAGHNLLRVIKWISSSDEMEIIISPQIRRYISHLYVSICQQTQHIYNYESCSL